MKNHYGHNIDVSDETIKEYSAPYCTDCNEVITEAGQIMKETTSVS